MQPLSAVLCDKVWSEMRYLMRFLPPLDVLVRLPLLPVMLWQGFWLRRTALVLPEAAGPRSGTQGQGRLLRLLILGDSSAAGVGASTQDRALSGQLAKALGKSCQIEWTLIARSGATTRATLKTLRAAPKAHYDVALISLGVNDAVRLLPARRWCTQHAALRQLLREKYGVQSIIVMGMPPLKDFPALTRLLRWIIGAHATRMGDALRAEVLAEADCALLEFKMQLTPKAMANDGYHPNEASYGLWAEMAAELIRERVLRL